MMKYLSKSVLLVCLLVVSGCRTYYNPDDSGMQKKMVYGGGFLFTTYQKVTDRTKPYAFYIEGDGAAFRNKMPSSNPTPRNPVALRLAAIDSRPNVVYIARPCQYTPMKDNPKCLASAKYWTSHRMSPDSVEAINEVINKINNNKKFSIIGFSGGGAIAPLIAARNNMVKDVITVAGNLDHVEFSRYHRVNPNNLSPSLNPVDFANKIYHIPQLHLSGTNDRKVPQFIAGKFTNKVNSFGKICAKHKVYSETSHGSGWEAVWHYSLYNNIQCD